VNKDKYLPYAIAAASLLLAAAAYVSAHQAIRWRAAREWNTTMSFAEGNSTSAVRVEVQSGIPEPEMLRVAFPLLESSDFCVITEAAVYCSGPMQRFDYRALQRCGYLEYLDLQSCEVSDDDLKTIARLPIKRLGLSVTTTITNAQAQWLSRERPDLHVER
jgi:hypothetical protein